MSLLSVPETRSRALEAARRAARLGFDEEPTVLWLLYRAHVAALRTIVESEHPATDRLLAEWLPGRRAGLDFDLCQLLPDGPFERYTVDQDLFDGVVDPIDAAIPLPEDVETTQLWRKLRLGFRTVLEGEAYRYAPFAVSRITLGQRDRWWYWWNGIAPVGIHDLEDPVPNDRHERQLQAVGWTEWICENLGDLHSLQIDGDRRTVDAVAAEARSHFPEAEISAKRRRG